MGAPILDVGVGIMDAGGPILDLVATRGGHIGPTVTPFHSLLGRAVSAAFSPVPKHAAAFGPIPKHVAAFDPFPENVASVLLELLPLLLLLAQPPRQTAEGRSCVEAEASRRLQRPGGGGQQDCAEASVPGRT